MFHTGSEGSVRVMISTDSAMMICTYTSVRMMQVAGVINRAARLTLSGSLEGDSTAGNSMGWCGSVPGSGAPGVSSVKHARPASAAHSILVH